MVPPVRLEAIAFSRTGTSADDALLATAAAQPPATAPVRRAPGIEAVLGAHSGHRVATIDSIS